MYDERHGKIMADKLLKIRLLHMRLQTILQGALLVVFVVALLIVGGRFSALQRGINMVNTQLQDIDMNEVNAAIASLSDAANRFSEIDVASLNDTVSSLHDAADKLSTADVAELNAAVASLRSAADTLDTLDVESRNSLVGSLDKAATVLENAVSGINGVFGR